MKQVLQYPSKAGLKVEECPPPACKPGGILVDNRVSLISPGTEKALMELASKSLIGKAKSRPDLVKQVIDKIRSDGLIATLNKVQARLKVPLPLGYSSCGLVTETGAGVGNFRVGDRVACAGFGYACHADQIFVPKNLAVSLPCNLSFREGSFVTLGAIALWGVRQSGCVLGERVAVIGLGLLGQLTVQILKAAGCQVIALDIDPDRLKEVEIYNPDLTVNSTDPHADKAVMHFTGGSGADAVIVTAAATSNQPIELAADICRDRGRVTVVGSVRMDIPRKPFYDKELTLNLSRSYGPGRYDPDYEEKGIDYPEGFVRWTENRNMQAFLDLVATGRINLQPLISATYPIEKAADAFELVKTSKTLGILLEYPEKRVPISTRIGAGKKAHGNNTLNVGFIGAGAFATGVLLPALKKAKRLNLWKLYSATPYRTKAAADNFKFQAVAQSEEEIFLDPDIDTVFIATPHYLHAEQVIKSLKAGKSVFVEKPLCLNHDQLTEIKSAYNNSDCVLMVGYNRRYSIAAQKIREVLKNRQAPVVFNYIVNAGLIPKKSWLRDDKLGGGRIIGEGCHFIDLIAYLTSSTITEIKTECISGQANEYRVDDNVVISLHLSDGSTGTITYTSQGDRKFPKETLLIFSDQAVLKMEDFRQVDLYRNGRNVSLYRGTMEKGFSAELAFFAEQCIRGQQAVEAESIFNSTDASILAVESLRDGQTKQVP